MLRPVKTHLPTIKNPLVLQSTLSSTSSFTLVIAGILLLGFVLHGIQANQLGLYWDDTEFLVLGMHVSKGNVMRFIFDDMTGFLTRERPLQYFAWTLARAFFAVSLPALHWLLVILLVLNALVLAYVARKLVGDNWFALGAGIFFLTYPISPLLAIWATNIHYLFSSLLALLAILLLVNGLLAGQTHRAWWFSSAAVAYLGSMLLHEAFVFVVPAFIIVHIMWTDRAEEPEGASKKRRRFLQPGLLALIFIMVVLLAWALWRYAVQPTYGIQDYEPSLVVMTPTTIANKVLEAAKTIVFPWHDLSTQLSAFPPHGEYVVLSAAFFCMVWVAVYQLSRPWTVDGESGIVGNRALGNRYLLRIAVTGAVLAISALVIVGISPLSAGGITGKNMFSRLFFSSLIGLGLGLPAVLALFLRFYDRDPALVAFAALSFLLCIGFVFFPLGGTIFSHRSELPTILDRYSPEYVIIVAAYIAALMLVGTMLILSFWRDLRKKVFLRQSLAGAIAFLVLLGSLFQFSVKQQYATYWEEQKVMFARMRALAPLLENNTFVVLHDRSNHPGLSHYELSAYLVVLYDNWSIMGNLVNFLRFHPDGIESTHYNEPVRWIPPQVVGPQTHTPVRKAPPLAHISYERIVIFEWEGTALRVVPSLAVKTAEGTTLEVRSNLKRILKEAAPPAAVWRHLTT
jgi:hypothetical protein